MRRATDAAVLMVGPDRSLRGGIVSVVDGYFNAGISDLCGKCDYLGTGVGANLASKSFAFVRALVTYERMLDSYEIVHLHMGPRGSYRRKSIMARIAKRHGKKVILHEHSGEFARDFDGGSDAYRNSVLRTFAAADKVVVLSEEWRDYFASHICDAAKIVVLHNGVEVPSKPCDPYPLQDVLFLGHLDANKSPDVLLHASKEALQRYPNMKIIFGGDGYLDRYRALAKDLGIVGRCEFLGWVSGQDKERLFSEVGIYCLPSKHEGMPMSVIEAMAHGIPVISTNVGGVPQLIESGINGLLMDVDDEKTLSAFLVELAGSPSLRKTLGTAGRKTVERKFSVKMAVDSLVDIYSSLTERPSYEPTR